MWKAGKTDGSFNHLSFMNNYWNSRYSIDPFELHRPNERTVIPRRHSRHSIAKTLKLNKNNRTHMYIHSFSCSETNTRSNLAWVEFFPFVRQLFLIKMDEIFYFPTRNNNKYFGRGFCHIIQ